MGPPHNGFYGFVGVENPKTLIPKPKVLSPEAFPTKASTASFSGAKLPRRKKAFSKLFRPETRCSRTCRRVRNPASWESWNPTESSNVRKTQGLVSVSMTSRTHLFCRRNLVDWTAKEAANQALADESLDPDAMVVSAFHTFARTSYVSKAWLLRRCDHERALASAASFCRSWSL